MEATTHQATGDGSERRWAFAGVLLVTAGLLLRGGFVDRALFIALNELALTWPLTASVLSLLGLGTSVFVGAGLLGVRRPGMPAAVLLAVLAGGLVVQVLKWSIASPRPLAVLRPDWVHVVGIALHTRSMPSGHASLLACLATMAWLAAPSRRRPILRRCGVAALTLVVVLGIGARVVVGAHWPSDVLVGAGLGLLAGVFLMRSGMGRTAVAAVRNWLTSRAGSRSMAALLVATSASIWVASRDHPLAGEVYPVLSGLGLVAAWCWWRLHEGPSWRTAVVRPLQRARERP